MDAVLTLATVVGMVAMLIYGRMAPSLVVVGAVIVLLVFGVVTPAEAFNGFSNPAPITVAALFVLAAGVEKTGALSPLVRTTMDGTSGRRRQLLRLLTPMASASAFFNNTPIVAMMAPQVARWAKQRGRAPSLYLMPLSFATILGGTLTLVGTSTNLVVSGLLEGHGFEGLRMFEITWVGVPLVIVGIALLVFLAPRLLPERHSAREDFSQNPREYVMSMDVVAGGALEGQSVQIAGLRDLQGVYLVEVERREQVIAPVAPTTILRGGDRLAFVGRVDLVRDLQSMPGLVHREIEASPSGRETNSTFFEAVLGDKSPLVGSTLKEVGFREQYQAGVVAIHRAGERVRAKLGEVRLQAGDVLLLVSDPGFAKRWQHAGDFLLVALLGGHLSMDRRRAIYALLIAAAVVLSATVGVTSILNASLLGAVALLVGGVLTSSEARQAVDLDTILVIAAAFGVGAALESSGLAALVGEGLVASFGSAGPLALLLGVTLTTIVLTELITNNAAAVLIFPIALAAAESQGLDPRPFAIAIAVAASASFLTPIGYQTNMMVYGLGGYRFSDYARLGGPLTLAVVVVILIVVPLIWPF